MHSLGISVYPDKSDIKEVYDYMETAAKLAQGRGLSDEAYSCRGYSESLLVFYLFQMIKEKVI